MDAIDNRINLRLRNIMDLSNNLTDLYLLTQVVEAGGFSAAARQTGTTRSRLSRRIIELEKRIGVQLLYRNAKRFALTATGLEVYRQALAIREAAVATQTILQQAVNTERGRVRIRADARLLPLMEKQLADYARQHPHVSLDVTTTDSSINALVDQQADVILHFGNSLPDSADIVAHTLGTTKEVVVASPAFCKQLERENSCARIRDDQWLVYSTWSGHADGHGPQFTSDNPAILLLAARAGLGCVRLPLYLCHNDLEQGHLKAVVPDELADPTPIHALTLQGKAVGKAITGIVRYLRRSLAMATQPGFEPRRSY